MVRSPSIADAFAVLAEPRRREILGALAGADRGGNTPRERDVTGLVRELGWPQPQVSRHLGVLREAGLVSVARKGRRRMYTVNGEQLRPLYDWIKAYEKHWDHQLERIRDRAERLARDEPPGDRPPPPPDSPHAN
jgi:DNA-binding transcriptional ArsR family regulator